MGRKRVTARIPLETYEAVEDVRKSENLDRAAAMERLLKRGIEAWQLDDAVERYRDGRASLEAAASRAGLSVWRFLEVLDERDVSVNYNLDDLNADIAAAEDE